MSNMDKKTDRSAVSLRYDNRVISADDQKIVLKEKLDKIINIPFAVIAKGILEIEF